MESIMHNIDKSNGRDNIAFLGSRNNIWHRLGHEMTEGMTIEEWQAKSGLDWSAVKVPAVADCSGLGLGLGMVPIEDRSFIMRSDTGGMLGYVSGDDESNGYKIVQPSELFHYFERYLAVDSRYSLDTAMSLKDGRLIVVTAKFDDGHGLKVLGEDHKARTIMSTTFDGSDATRNFMSMVRVVCNNTFDAAITDSRAMVTTRHSTKFDAAKAAKELANMAKSIESYRLMAESMVSIELSNQDIAAFFRACLDIPASATRDDISTKKANQFEALGEAYKSTLQEGTDRNTAWAAFNAVTRYADHDKTTRNGNSVEEAKFLSSQFGSGKALKGKAFNLLLPDWSKVALAA
jgi:phage/plasmid-like protein (TIGR03299 family)